MSLHLSFFLSNHLLRFWFSYTLVLLCFLFGQSYLCCHIPWKLGPSLNICFFMHCLTFYMSICLLISYIWNLAIGHFHACPLFHSVTLPWQSAWDSFHQMEFSFFSYTVFYFGRLQSSCIPQIYLNPTVLYFLQNLTLASYHSTSCLLVNLVSLPLLLLSSQTDDIISCVFHECLVWRLWIFYILDLLAVTHFVSSDYR